MCIQFALFAFFYFPEFFACFCMSLPGWLRVPLSYSFPVDHEDTSLKKRIHWAQQKCVRRNSTCTSPTSFVASHCLHNLHILHICLANLRKECLKKSQIWKKHLLMVHTSCYLWPPALPGTSCVPWWARETSSLLTRSTANLLKTGWTSHITISCLKKKSDEFSNCDICKLK